MDGNTAQPQPQSGKNKLLIIVGSIVIALILLVPLILILMKGSSPKGSESVTKSGVSSILPFAKPTPNVKKAPVPTPYFAWDIYTDSKFSVAYPQTWVIQQTRETEGQTAVFKPPTIPITEYLPSIMITVRENKTRPWLTESEDYYRTSLGYQQSTVMLDGVKATKLFGTFPAAKGKTPVQSIHIFLVKDNFSYLIKYEYPGRKYNVEYEKLFTSMVANFKFR